MKMKMRMLTICFSKRKAKVQRTRELFIKDQLEEFSDKNLQQCLFLFIVWIPTFGSVSLTLLTTYSY